MADTLTLLERARAVCERCGKRFRRKAAAVWNIQSKDGWIVAMICPDCQTPEENAEADIREATTDYSRIAIRGVRLSR